MIIRGARQVGKTSALRFFGKSFENLLEINFELRPDAGGIFKRNLEPGRICRELSILFEQEIHDGNTLLFFDEVQECPEALLSLRYFFEQRPNLHVVAAGSLLEFVLEQISMPVGRVEFQWMYPLTFREFLVANGKKQLADAIADSILDTDFNISPLSRPLTQALGDALRDFAIVGGLPEAVATWVETQSFKSVEAIHDRLAQAFRDDIRKYAKGEKQLANLMSVFARCFRFVGRQATYTDLGDGDDIRRTKTSLLILEQALLVHLVRSCNTPTLPLDAYASDKHFKLVFVDIGLGLRLVGHTKKSLSAEGTLFEVMQGALAEQFVGQQILAQHLNQTTHRQLFFWKRDEPGSAAEIDYLLARDGAVFPIEIKSGKSGRLRSLHMYLKKHGGRGICLKDTENISEHESVIFAPLWSTL